jgi:exosortase D (VPLPA-CTERM-specific)
VKFALFGALLAGIYYTAYSWLIQHDWPREDYTYCYLIPLVVLYLIWEKKKDLAAKSAVPSWGGLLFLVPGILLFWVGDLAGELYSLYLSSWLVAVGILWMHIGWQKLKVIAFALFMALTMFPLPNFLNTKVTFGLKLISSQLGVWLIQVYGMSAYREGNVIDLGFTQLQVVDACSGLRYLFPLLVMGILLAYFYRAALWKRIILVLSTIPLTIVTNSLRIALTGLIHAHLGAAAAEGFFHGFSGWLIFLFGLGFLLLEMWVLSWVPPKTEGRGKREEGRNSKTEDRRRKTEAEKTPDLKLNTENLKLSVFQPTFIVAVLLLGGTLVLSKTVEFREKVPSSKPFNQFPLKVGTWEGTRKYMGQEIIRELDLSDYTMIDFRRDGKPLDFYVAYYESQRKGESIHSPETCLPAGGWIFRQAGTVTVPFLNPQATNQRVNDSTPPAVRPSQGIKVNRAFIEKSGQRQFIYFWFPARGRILTNAWELKLYTFWDSLTRQRTDGALVRLITPVLQGEQVEDAEKRLQDFTRHIVPVLNEFIPN